MFPLSVCCVTIVIFSTAAGYPWGTSDCGPPGHNGGSSSDATGLSVAMDGSKVILSSSRGAFRGFYMRSDQNLVWVDPPAGSLLAHLAPQRRRTVAASHTRSGTTASSVCSGSANTVLFHSNSNAKSLVSSNIACSPGQAFSVSAYVVFSFSAPYISFTSQVKTASKDILVDLPHLNICFNVCVTLNRQVVCGNGTGSGSPPALLVNRLPVRYMPSPQ